MGFSFNGVSPEIVKFNGEDVEHIIFNGTEVWDSRCYKFNVANGSNSQYVNVVVAASDTKDATVTFAGVTKTVTAGTSATVTFTSTDTSTTSGLVVVKNSKSCIPGTYTTGSGKNATTKQWVGISGIVKFDTSWTSVPTKFLYKQTSISGSLVIPKYYTSIGDYAFDGCTGLTSITLSDNLTSIGAQAFAGCTALSAPNTYSGINYIGGPTKLYIYAMSLASTSQTSYIIHAQTLGAAFTWDSTLEGAANAAIYTVESANTVYSSENGIMYNKNKTEIVAVPMKLAGNIILPTSITSIGASMFAGRTSLTRMKAAGLTEIGASAFSGCSSLIRFIGGSNVFQSSDDLSEGDSWCDIGSSISDIGEKAFESTLLTRYRVLANTSLTTGNYWPSSNIFKIYYDLRSFDGGGTLGLLSVGSTTLQSYMVRSSDPAITNTNMLNFGYPTSINKAIRYCYISTQAYTHRNDSTTGDDGTVTYTYKAMHDAYLANGDNNANGQEYLLEDININDDTLWTLAIALSAESV